MCTRARIDFFFFFFFEIERGGWQGRKRSKYRRTIMAARKINTRLTRAGRVQSTFDFAMIYNEKGPCSHLIQIRMRLQRTKFKSGMSVGQLNNFLFNLSN